MTERGGERVMTHMPDDAKAVKLSNAQWNTLNSLLDGDWRVGVDLRSGEALVRKQLVEARGSSVNVWHPREYRINAAGRAAAALRCAAGRRRGVMERLMLVLSGAWVGITIVLMLTMLALFLGTTGTISTLSLSILWVLGLVVLPHAVLAWHSFRGLVTNQKAARP